MDDPPLIALCIKFLRDICVLGLGGIEILVLGILYRKTAMLLFIASFKKPVD